MKTTFMRSTGQAVLTAESADDQTLIDAAHHHRVLLIDAFSGERVASGGREMTSMQLTVDAADPRALRAKASREALGALGQLFRLGLREAAEDVHASATAADPKAQEELAARLVQLKVVSEPSGSEIGNRESRVEEVKSTHGGSVVTPPAIGAYWPGQGGIYAGVVRGAAGQSDRRLIVASKDAAGEPLTFGPRGKDINGATSEWDGAANTRALVEHGNHPAAVACAAYVADGHSDFYLPSRRELALCFANAAIELDGSSWFWSSTQVSRFYAFVQDFELGFSTWLGKDNGHRVRACRGLPLHPLNPSLAASAAEGGPL